MSPEIFELLVIDDEAEILKLISASLRDHVIRHDVAGSIAAARALLRERTYRVILADHRLPDGNGLDLLTEISSGDSPPIPMLMTGLVDVDLAIAAINQGRVFKLLTKPLSPLILLQTVQSAISQHRRDTERFRLTGEVLRYAEQLRQRSEHNEQGLAAAHERLRSSTRTMEEQQQVIAQLYADLQQSYLSTVMSLSEVIDARDRYTRGHSDRVYDYCLLIARELDLDEAQRNDLRVASALHDLGKIGVPDAILQKGGPLEQEEFSIMRSHPDLTEKILEPLPFLDSVRRIVREHHERFDGAGYPAGTRGTDICLGARILSVADAFDAMRSDRPYRRALEPNAAMAELQKESGTQFCPMCVGALLIALQRPQPGQPKTLQNPRQRLAKQAK
jgi:response regulator RpfG family c-di-GMP phosphodiesterase